MITFCVFVLIPLETVSLGIPCRQANLPIPTADWYVWFMLFIIYYSIVDEVYRSKK